MKKITNGEETVPGRYPYQVALYKSTDEFGCAGTLIAPDWVLTAAHCGGGFSRVEIGRHDRSNSNEVYESIDIAFEVQHPGYILDSTQIIHDVMLLKLRSPSNYTTVKLDDGQVDLTTPGTVTTSIGWGKTDYLNHDHNDILLETENWIVDNYECGFYYDELGHVVTDDMICASREEGKGTCKGDSGGPLLIKGDDATSDIQIGITSWGTGCASPDYPGVKARISAEIDFIKSVQECEVPRSSVFFKSCCKASCKDGVFTCDSHICLHRNAVIWDYWVGVKDEALEYPFVEYIRSLLNWMGML